VVRSSYWEPIPARLPKHELISFNGISTLVAAWKILSSNPAGSTRACHLLYVSQIRSSEIFAICSELCC
jgi:hypothetical protein